MAKPGTSPDPQSIIAARGRIAPFKLPKSVEFILLCRAQCFKISSPAARALLAGSRAG